MIVVYVEFAGPPAVNTDVKSNIWKEPMTEIMKTKNVVGEIRGTVILKNVRRGDDPSI